ncbi:MAG: SWF/SNF helicase family protein, partial [Clostridiales bacterium]|nr:SWF/SNF helicase family protein [Clostridiales bacterium]
MDGGHRMLVFSQFTGALDLVEEDLKERNIAYEKLTGETPKGERLSMVQRFNGGNTPVFLISLKAGGTGLNLTGADLVVLLDPWWNAAAETQAADRAHRIGQKHPVTVYRIIAKDTIEERILELQEKKRQLADDILSGSASGAAALSREELLELLKQRKGTR